LADLDERLDCRLSVGRGSRVALQQKIRKAGADVAIPSCPSAKLGVRRVMKIVPSGEPPALDSEH
jgi:hypothetical protein